MKSWERFSHNERRTWIPTPPNPGQYAPPPFPPGAEAHHPPGMTSFQTSYFDRPPPPPQAPNPPYGQSHGQSYRQPHGQPHGQPYLYPYMTAYGPAYAPAYGPPRPPRPTPGFVPTSGGYIPTPNNPVPNPPPYYGHGYYHVNPSAGHTQYPGHPQYQPPQQPHQSYAQYGPPPPPPPGYTHHQTHQEQERTPPYPPYTRPTSRQTLRPFPHLPHWPPNEIPISARTNTHPPSAPLNPDPIPLMLRPETMTFHSEPELRIRLTSVFRPMVGVLGRQVQERLGLAEQPHVKFDLYPVQVDEQGRSPAIRWRTLSRAPVYCVTLPHAGVSEERLQEVSDALKEILADYPNAWYRQAGYVFRISRSAVLGEGEVRKRFWVPPMCVYKFFRSEGVYRALFIEVSEEAVEEVDGFHDYGDTSEDDQAALVDEMWADVRRRNAYGPWVANPEYL
ncbi:uncharacterized protein GGS22DRAFT_184216 [Annulohypoxylon maeteangense]|uniref:uncharacterized protein n=1 Tax=Annulohypoxylon maeteangense TaxID=1927788 RepID=UPI00200873B4|nr:uncharacterized protein GGS22DRAFT_184216 [Annulohypoxylon maeteangense]KAI0888637.1 hypothetical protein GGS22DRAFT_184216 [Annulohypoxylon maeteangense]